MSYVDAVLAKDKDTIHVVERDEGGVRRYVDYPTNYVLYYEDPRGKYRSVFGDSLSKFSTRKNSEFQKERRILSNKRLFESDVNPVFRCLAGNYLDRPAPSLHTAFFDIEVNMQPYAYPNSHEVKITNGSETKYITVHELSHLLHKEEWQAYDPDNAAWEPVHSCKYLKLGPGFASTTDPFNDVTAITLYLDWLDQLITLCIPPAHISHQDARDLVSDIDNVFIFENEVDMFDAFFALIDDADVLTGWNSEIYDIPYMINRVTRVMSKDDTRRFCLLGQLPRQKIINRFGKNETTYELSGRVHMDYLQLYKKYNYEQRHSYKLDYIGEMEVGENKTQYEGTLDQLFNRDWRKFIQYNRQDTLLVYKIHAKLKFLDLANQLAHENTVLLRTVLGSVAMIEQAIINEAHNRNLIVQDKSNVRVKDEIHENNDDDEEDITAAGAYVATPKRGMHEWVAACDINSLYPSVIRAINMAPETIVGQLRQTLTEQYIEDKKTRLAGEKRNKTSKDITGPVLWEGLFGSLEYTAVMNQERETLITVDWERGGSDTYSAAEIWSMIFDSNQQWMLSANGTIFTHEREGVIPGLLTRWYSERKQIQAKLKKATSKEEQEFLDKRQLVRKILLNSAYGALLNLHCRFYDLRIGQSVTLSGRQIVKHMGSKLNELITGDYDINGNAVIYGDSVTGDSLIRTSDGDMAIEDLYANCLEHSIVGEKEYGTLNETKVLGFNADQMEPNAYSISYVMRHKTKKKLYRVTTKNGKQVVITEDHSLIVDRDGFLIEVKPTEIKETDLIITYSDDAIWSKVKSVECLGEVDDYVYDLSIEDADPYFFANDILVHNTDSIYYSIWPVIKEKDATENIEWSKERAIEIYDDLANDTNASFPQFMKDAFHCPTKNGEIIRAGRELVGDRALFITKKRYAVNIYDKEGKRLDVGGKRGKIKAMGLDLKRSDTPKFVQSFLMEVLEEVLAGKEKEFIVEKIKSFKRELSAMNSWTKGSPKSVNKLTLYSDKARANSRKIDRTIFASDGDDEAGDTAMPGHVRASLNWNYLRHLNSDNYSMQIVDGMRIVVCKLKSNHYGFTSIAYPTDELRLPPWFLSLPFDDAGMEKTLVDEKIDNLLSVLNWNLEELTSIDETLADLFVFE